jgi:hypothetical protein
LKPASISKFWGASLVARVNSGNGDAIALVVKAYSVDAVGRKLISGARKGVTRTVLTGFLPTWNTAQRSRNEFLNKCAWLAAPVLKE